jgi:branched-chain amino acid transport system substrate-binding protein
MHKKNGTEAPSMSLGGNMKPITAVLGLCAVLCCGVANAQTKTIKIGALSDQSSLFAKSGGPGSTLAAEMAVEDSGLLQRGWKIEVVSSDHKNKVDIGTGIARRWFDADRFDVIVDMANSDVALAVNQVVKDNNKVLIVSGAATSELTGTACTPNTVHWAYDTYSLANTTGAAMTKAGGDTWAFIVSDYSFGQTMAKETSAAVVKSGGKVIAEIRHPLNTTEFSSVLLQAQGSGANVIGFANSGSDTIRSIKQAAEFDMNSGDQKLAALLLRISEVHELGLNVAQNVLLTETFYWDMNDETRAFSDRFAKRNKDGAKPTMIQAGVYAGTLHYLKAADALGDVTDGKKVVAKMKEMPTDDPLFGKGSIRADGRKIHPAFLFQVKTPAESKGPWDYYKLVATVPADQAFRPIADSECPLVKK